MSDNEPNPTTNHHGAPESLQQAVGESQADGCPIKHEAIRNIGELFELHWSEAVASADDDGKVAISFRVVANLGAPARVKVTSRISRTSTDEIESTVAEPGQTPPPRALETDPDA